MYTTGIDDSWWTSVPWLTTMTTIYFQLIPLKIDNCSCPLSDECKAPFFMRNYTFWLHGHRDPPAAANFSNIFVGCFSIQALLHSSLECFFNQTCSDIVQKQINEIIGSKNRSLTYVPILQASFTKFSPKKSVGEIVNEMMIETWGDKIQYEQYYEQCAPKFCSYTLKSRNDALYVFTTMIALFGGLSVALKVIVPPIVSWIRNRTRPQVETGHMTGKSSRNKEKCLRRNFFM
jgi:hypothetical protein